MEEHKTEGRTREYDPLRGDDRRRVAVTPEVVRALRDGDQQAYVTVHLHYVNPLKRFLVRLTGSEEDSREILQDVFMKVWEYRERIDPERSIKSYLYAISKNAALNYLRIKQRYSALPETDGYGDEVYYDASEELVSEETRLLVEIAIENMPQKRREVFRLYQEGLSYEEIAARLDITQNNVRQYILRARRDISEIMALVTFFLTTV